MPERNLQRRIPVVQDANEYLEITRDYVDPRDAIREGISNALDWGANTVKVIVSEDRRRPDEELIIEISDDGVGLDAGRLEAFFDLGKRHGEIEAENPQARTDRIGYKGHGTKTYFNSRRIEVLSDSANSTVYAIMETPLQILMTGEVPPYDYDIQERPNERTFTTIKIYGYNTNQNRRDFAHNVLKDYVLWFTKFGSVEKEFGINANSNKRLLLKGLGQEHEDTVEFGHRFAAINDNIAQLAIQNPGAWTKQFSKKWIFSNRAIINHPGKYIDIVFYIEGDQAKRTYNNMIRLRTGRNHAYGTYKVEDRYGLWACKDHIPVHIYNDWLGLGQRLETQYHAFVNCQDFRLTANRGDVANTPPDLLGAIRETVQQIYEDNIVGSREYQDYAEAATVAEGYQTAAQERIGFDRRKNHAITKKAATLRGVELLEPRMEMGVLALFNVVHSLEPNIFPFHIVDYDSNKGYDALATQQMAQNLDRDSIFFLEFKHLLTADFNHSFENVFAIVCWDCALGHDSEMVDIKRIRRRLNISPPEGDRNYTKYMLINPTARHNIEVYVLKDYLREKLGIEFRPRQLLDRH